MKDAFFPTRTSFKRCLLIICTILCLYILENSSLRLIFDSLTFNNIITPTLWGVLLILVWLLPKIRPSSKLKHKSFLNWWAFNFAFIFIIITIIAALIDGFGRSPYDHSLKGIFFNVVTVGVALIAREFARSYLVNSFTRKENYLIFIIISIFITGISIPLKQITNLQGLESIVEFIARYIAPEFAKNLFATYLVFVGGPITSIIYLGFLEGFHWLSPILPDLKWITTALIGILCPLFSLIALQNMYQTQAKLISKRAQEGEGTLGWIITSVVSIAIIWFTVGVFPIYPSVIATGSMEPMIKPGDVILIEKVTNETIDDLEKGDIIQFERENILISHRIIEIVEDEEQGICYRTKGDNNSSSDSQLVNQGLVRGKVIEVIPKVGWPTLLLKSKDDIPLDEIEF